MKLWIRLDVAIRSDPNVHELAERLNIPFAEAVGLCALVWAAIAEHRPNGDISGLSIVTLEHWAEYCPRRGKPAGAFGALFLELFASDGEASGWHGRQGALIDRADRERARKRRGKRAEVPQMLAPTERNGTEPTTKAIPAKAVSWPGEAAEVWRAVAPIPIPRLGKALKPVVDEYGWPDTKAALECYVSLNQGKTRKVEWFAGDAVRWLALSKMPCVDPITRELTEKGRMA